jgi:hypothetical protein
MTVNTYRIFYAHRPDECIAVMTGKDRLEAVHAFIRNIDTDTLRAFKGKHGRYPDLDADFIVELRNPIGIGEGDWPRCGARWVRV